jgi:ATP-dependent DNA helicase RecG
MFLQSDSPVQYVRGVGPRRAEHFAALGIHTVADLLEYFPVRYELHHGELEIADLRPGMNATIRGEVVRVRSRWPGFTAEITDGTGTCTLRWFQPLRGRHGLDRGAVVVASGPAQEFNGRLELVQPRISVFRAESVLLKGNRRAAQVPVYRGSPELRSPLIRQVIQNVLAQPRLPVDDFVPAALLHRHGLPPREQAVRQIHEPADQEALAQARRRLAYEEFLLLELAMALRRRRLLALESGQKLVVTPEIDRRIRARFPFELTAAQNKVIGEICGDLNSGRPMTRLLQGDVGSGKTVVALYACLVAIAHRRQAAIMTPTEILARQHFANIERYLAGSRTRRLLLSGGLPAGERSRALAAVERGEIDLLVGTQALIQADVNFRDLALVVVDEQHKFGVLQRARFRTKGPMPHYLVMTATPIPRTLAMTVFGDLDVSIISESPPGRGRIITKVVAPARWETVMNYVRARLERGEQAYVVCPRIGGPPQDGGTDEQVQSGAASLQDGARRENRRATGASESVAVNFAPSPAGEAALSARLVWKRLSEGPWSGLKVGLLYGSMPAASRQAAIGAFAAGELHAMVSTTVVEVGVDVPNATIMIVEHAERFGLSQLHQLRGRVGRGSRDSLCVLIARGHGPKAAERLAVLAQTTDGFRIAEADLRQRGPGQLLGTRQHGLPELRYGNLVEDFELLEKARRDAFEIVARDPELRDPAHAALLPPLRRMFGAKLALIDAG